MCRLRPLIFFPPSKPLLAAPTVSAALTDWESIDPAVGKSARPHATRSRPRSRSTSPWGRPRAFHRSKKAYTAAQGGKSTGSAQPLDAVAGHVTDHVEHRPQIMLHRSPGRAATQLGHHRLGLRAQQRPLSIGHIRGITRHALVTRASQHAATGLRGLDTVDRHPRASGRSGRWYSSAIRSPFFTPGATRHRDQIATHRHLRPTQPTSFTNRL